MKKIEVVADDTRFAKGTVGVTKEVYKQLKDVNTPAELVVTNQKDEELCRITNEVLLN